MKQGRVAWWILRPTAVVIVVALCPVRATAQWIPPKKSGYLYLTYGNFGTSEHLFSEDLPPDFVTTGDNGDGGAIGTIDSQAVALGGQYSFTNRLSLDGSVSYVQSRYRGDFPESETIDDGDWHGDFQDFLLNFSWKAYDGAVTLTPFVGLVVPTHNYDIIGHAAVGRNLNEANLGFALGVPIGRPAFWALGYAYSFVEVPDGYDGSLDRSDIHTEFGYFWRIGLGVRVFGDYRKTHGGIDWLNEVPEPGEEDHIGHIHDQAAAAEALRLGLSVSYNISRSFDIYASYGWTVADQTGNSHDISGFVIGTTWNFGGLLFGKEAKDPTIR